MRRESYSAATQCSLDAFGHTFIASHPVLHNAGSKTLQDMDRKFKNERTPQQAFTKPGSWAGVNAR
jgi:hypothetical protein